MKVLTKAYMSSTEYMKFLRRKIRLSSYCHLEKHIIENLDVNTPLRKTESSDLKKTLITKEIEIPLIEIPLRFLGAGHFSKILLHFFLRW